MSERFRRSRQHVFVFIAVWALLLSAGCGNPFNVFLDDDDGPGPPLPSEFVATLSGDQEVPPVDTLASGEAVLTLNSTETMLNFEVTIADLPSNNVTQVNLNVAPPGFNGPIVFFLTRGGPPFAFPLRGSLTAQDLIPNADVSVETFAEFVDTLRAGDVYVDVHTIQHPRGEIRGQAQGAATFLSNLDGGEEVPPVDTLASGDAVLTLNATETMLGFEVTIADLPSNNVTQVNLNVAPPGFNGPIVFLLTRGGPPFAFPLRGSLTAQDLIPNADVSVETFAEFADAMKAGDVYVNVHTVEHPAGEIRGQAQSTATFPSNLDGGQEVPPVVTSASGRGQVVLNAEQTALRFTLEVSDLPADQITQAHIHVAPPGVNGPVVFFLSDMSFTSPLIGTLTAADFIPAPEIGVDTFEDFLAVLFAGDTYMNVHTVTNPTGEVRGQLEQ